MKKDIDKINEGQLSKIVAESVKRVLKENFDNNDLGYTIEETEEEFNQCYEDLDLYVENMCKSYSLRTILEVLRRLTEFYEKNVQ